MKTDKSVQITGMIVLGVVLLGLIIAFSFSSMNPSSSNTISVLGESNIKAIPDLVAVYFAVDTKGATSSEATSKNAEIVEKLKQNLIAKDFSEDEIQTQGFNVYPNYRWDGQRQIEDGYRATHSLVVKMSTEESKKIGDSVDAAVDSGAGISYINFELSQEKQNQYKAQALEQAAKDAKIKAEAVALGFNKKLGRLVSTQVSDFGYYPWLAYSATMDSSAAEIKREATSIVPSEQDINARITATFRIR